MGYDATVNPIDHDPNAALESVVSILESTRLLSLATLKPDGAPWVNNAYFSIDRQLRLLFLTPPSTEHATNLELDARASVSVADSQQTGDSGKRGLQLSGTCRRVSASELPDALASYRERFPATRDALQSLDAMVASGMESRLYAFASHSIRIFDEVTYGAEVWIDCTVG